MVDSFEQGKALPYIPEIERVIAGDLSVHRLAALTKNAAFSEIWTSRHEPDDKKLDAFVEILLPLVRTKLAQIASEYGAENLSEEVVQQYGKFDPNEIGPLLGYLDQNKFVSSDEKMILLNFASHALNGISQWSHAAVIKDLESVIEFSISQSSGDLEADSTLARKLTVYKAARESTLDLQELGEGDNISALDGAIAGEQEGLIEPLLRQCGSIDIISRIEDSLSAGRMTSVRTLIKMAPEIKGKENADASIVSDLVKNAIHRFDAERLGQLLEIAKELGLTLKTSNLTYAFVSLINGRNKNENMGGLLTQVVDYLSEKNEIDTLPKENAKDLLCGALRAQDEDIVALFLGRMSAKDLERKCFSVSAISEDRDMNRMVLEELSKRGWPINWKELFYQATNVRTTTHGTYVAWDEICNFAKEHGIFIDFDKVRVISSDFSSKDGSYLSGLTAPAQIDGVIEMFGSQEKGYPEARIGRAILEQRNAGLSASPPEVSHVQRQEACAFLKDIDLTENGQATTVEIPAGLAPAVAVELGKAGIKPDDYSLWPDEMRIDAGALERVKEQLNGRGKS